MPMHDYLKSSLIENLREKAYPVFSFEDRVIPAASIWTTSRAWVHTFRSLNLSKGDRIVIKIPESPAFLGILIASIWEEFCLCILPPSEQVDDAVNFFDAVLSISNESSASYNLSTEDLLNPDQTTVEPRNVHDRSTGGEIFILRSSGTSSNGRWSVLPRQGVTHVLKSHIDVLEFLPEEITLSVLPWHHCFGLVLDLLPSLLHQVEVHRRTDGGRNIDDLLQQIYSLGEVRFNAVPIHLKRLLEKDENILSHLKQGIIGGAAIPESLAEKLMQSNLRVGYGQTEACPGICLGEKGVFTAAALGTPLGCSIDIDSDSQLHFTGENAFSGYWTKNGFEKNHNNKIATGDLVHQNSDGSLRFLGRIDDRIKLLNGREIDPLEIEKKLLTQFPHIQDACILTLNSIQLELLILAVKNSLLPSDNELKESLGGFSSLINNIHYLNQKDWHLNPKGDKKRAKFKRYLLNKSP